MGEVAAEVDGLWVEWILGLLGIRVFGGDVLRVAKRRQVLKKGYIAPPLRRRS